LADRHCKRIFQPGTETQNIFLTLLRTYLRPLVKTADDLLRPALELIERHGPRLDPEETLQLLPPLVSARDVRIFLIGALRVPRFDARVVREVALARKDQVARRLMYLEANRVKITDSRMYVFMRAGPYSEMLIRFSQLSVVSQEDRAKRHCRSRTWVRTHVYSILRDFLNNLRHVVAKSRIITAVKHLPNG
jgi:hypothetical protein